MSQGFEAYIEPGAKALEQLNNYRQAAKRAKEIINAFWSDAKVYVFGSVLEGKITAASDIDILIVADGVSREEAYRAKAAVYKAVDAPVELHMASTAELEHWYKRFLDKLEENR
ncbi:MAG: nucleotidyltransferase domain-containing protein [Candidatus Bathyarchaeia archaeon]